MAGARSQDRFPASERLKPYVPRLVVDWLREGPNDRHRRVTGSLAFVIVAAAVVVFALVRLEGGSGSRHTSP